MNIRYIDQISLKGKSVFIREDLNVPLTEDNKSGNSTTYKVADNYRIKSALPTIKYAVGAGAKVILSSHLGRPKGKPEEKYSLIHLKSEIETLYQSFLNPSDLIFASDCIGAEVEALKSALKPGQVLVLENLRFHAEEEKNSLDFAKKLALQIDVFVNDAFSCSHRAHASIAAITECVKEKCGGLTLKQELENFSKAFDNPERPLALIFGGAKTSTKLQAVNNVLDKVDKIFIGGAMANTFLMAKGNEMGKSLVESELIEDAKEILETLERKKKQVFLPIDVVVAKEFKEGQVAQVVEVNAVPKDLMALDIGPKTIELFKKELEDVKTIIWNGPMGAFEVAEFSKGTFQLIDILTKSKAFTVVGGGDTDHALHQCHAFDKMGYVSTAGGAFLTMLEGTPLPGVECLKN